MVSTPASLLDRLRENGEASAWDRFVELYSPLLFHWAKKLGLQDSDASDLVQDLFLLLWRKLPEFQYDPAQRFQGWLKTLFLNQHRQHLRQRKPLPADHAWDELPERSEEIFEEREYRRYIVRQAFHLIQREFSPQQRSAFEEYALRQRSPIDVARELGIAPGTVYGIKSKILNRLRQELRDLVD